MCVCVTMFVFVDPFSRLVHVGNLRNTTIIGVAVCWHILINWRARVVLWESAEVGIESNWLPSRKANYLPRRPGLCFVYQLYRVLEAARSPAGGDHVSKTGFACGCLFPQVTQVLEGSPSTWEEQPFDTAIDCRRKSRENYFCRSRQGVTRLS